jgi:O-antigen/teichoic acid export membrane protein
MARILLATNFFIATTAVGFNILIGMEKIKPLLTINLISLFLNVVFTVILISLMGVVGAVIGTFLSQVLVWFPYNHLYLKELRVSWLAYWQIALIRPYLVAVILITLILLINMIFRPTNLLETIFLGGTLAAIYVLIFSAIGLDSLERQKLLFWLKLLYTRLKLGVFSWQKSA